MQNSTPMSSELSDGKSPNEGKTSFTKTSNKSETNSLCPDDKISSLRTDGGSLGDHDSNISEKELIVNKNIQSREDLDLPQLGTTNRLLSSHGKHRKHKGCQPVHSSANHEQAFGHSPETNLNQFKHHLQHPSRFGNSPSYNIPIMPNSHTPSPPSPCRIDSHHGNIIFHDDNADFPTGPSPIQNSSFTEDSPIDEPNPAILSKASDGKICPLTLSPTLHVSTHNTDNICTSPSISTSSQTLRSKNVKQNSKQNQRLATDFIQNPSIKSHQTRLRPSQSSTSPPVDSTPCQGKSTQPQKPFRSAEITQQMKAGFSKSNDLSHSKPHAAIDKSQQQKQATSETTDVITYPSIRPLVVSSNSSVSGANGGGTIYSHCQISISGTDVQLGNNNNNNSYETAV